MTTFKIGSTSNPSSIAGALTAVVKKEGSSELHAIGAASVNQAIKAIAIARGFMAPLGFNLICTPAFLETLIDNEIRTGIKLIVRPMPI